MEKISVLKHHMADRPLPEEADSLRMFWTPMDNEHERWEACTEFRVAGKEVVTPRAGLFCSLGQNSAIPEAQLELASKHCNA